MNSTTPLRPFALTFVGFALLLAGELTLPAANIALTNSDAFGSSSWNAKGNWNSSSAPGSGNDYFTANFQLRTPNDAVNPNAFAGTSLSVDPGGGINTKHGGYWTNSLLKLNGGSINLGGGASERPTTNFGTIQLSGTVNSTLATDTRGRSAELRSTITGSGSANFVISNIWAGVTLSAANTFNNGVAITNALVRLNNATALGTVTGGTFIGAGGMLELNGISPGGEPVTVSGGGTNGSIGAIVNAGTALQNNGLKGPVTLTGDTVFGGANRWDIYTPGTLNANGFKLTKVGGNEVALANLGNTSLGDIQVNAGTLTFLGNTTMGDPAKTATVSAGTLNFWAVNNTLATPLAKNVIIQSGANFNNNSGTNFFSGSITLNGNANIGGNGTEMTLLGPLSGTGNLFKGGSHKLVLLGANTYTGNTTINLNSGTLVLGPSGSISTSPILTVNPASTFDASAVTGGWILMPGQILIDNGSVLGSVRVEAGALAYGDGLMSNNVTVAPDGTLTPGQLATPGTLSLLQDLTCEDGSLLGFDLANVAVLDGGINDYIAVGGNLSLNGTVGVNFAMLSGAPALGVPYTLIKYSGTLTGNAANLVGNSPYPATFDTSVPGEIRVTFAAGTPGALTWMGDGSANRWDAGVSPNWFDGVSAALFSQGDDVLFNDSTANLTANLVGGLTPNTVTVNAAGNYTFAGSGFLGGTASLTKQGSGILTVSNANTHAGATVIEGGTLKLGNSLAVGSAVGATYVTNGGTLDVNSLRVGSFASETVVVSGAGVGGNGAIVNNGSGGQNSALRIVNLTGDTTVGGAQRFDVRNDGGNASVSTGGQPFNYIKRGVNDHIWVGVEVDPALGDIEILEGRFGPETTTSGSLGDPARTIYVGANATFRFYGWNNSLAKNMVLTNGAILWVNNGMGRILSSVTLDSGMAIADPDGNTLALSNVVSGAGGFNKIDTGTLILAGTNTFTGGVSNGAGTVIGSTASLPGPVTNYATLTVDQPFDGALAGPLVGPGAATLNKAGLGTVAINNAGGYLGTANINAGMLTLPADNVFAATNINFNGGGISSADANARTITNFFTSSANFPTPTVLGLPNSGDLTLTAPVGNNGGQNKYWVISNSLVTVNSVLAGNGTITKAGPGTLQLNAINALSALTNAEGIVALGASGMISNANITLLPGAVLDASAQGSLKLFTGKTLIAGRTAAPATDILGGLTSTGIVTVANVAVAGTLTIGGGLTLAGGTLNFDLANVTTAGVGVNDLITIGGSLDLAGTTTIQITPLNGPLANGTYTLVSGGTGLNSGSAANLTLTGTNTTRQTFTIDVTSNPGSILLIVGNSAPSLVWSGATTANWDINSSAAWMNGGLPDKFWNYDAVLFDGTTINPLVNLTATVLPSSFVVDAPAAFNHVISGSGKISGSVGLTKNGQGILTLSTPNDFTGPVIVNAGAVRMGNSNAFGIINTITVAPGAQVDINGTTALQGKIHSYYLSGSGMDGFGALRNDSATGPMAAGIQNVTLNADAALYVNGRIDICDAGGVRAGLVNGNGFRLTRNGPGAMPIHGTVIDLAELIINNGLVYSETRDFNLGTKVTINAPGRVGSYGFRTNDAELVFNGGTWENTGSSTAHWFGPATINAPITVQLLGTSAGTSPQDIRQFGLLNGTGWINLVGGGSKAFELYANNDATFSGNYTVAGSTILRLVNGGTFGSGIVTNNGTVEFNQNFDYGFAYTILGGGTITKNLTNILQLAGASGDQFGDLATLNVAGGMVDLNGRMEAIRGLTGSAVVSNSAATTATLILTNPSGTPTFSGTIAGNTTVIVKDSSAKNSNVQIFSGSNLFTGKLVIDNGHLRAANDWFYGAVPGAFDADNITIKNGGVLQNYDSFLSLHPNRGIRLDGGDGQFYAGWTKDITVNGAISGSGNLVKMDGGRLFLNAANIYTGNTYINQGRLLLTAGGTIDTSPLITIAGGAVLDVTAKGVYQIPLGQTINGVGSVAGSVALPAGATVAPGTSLGTLTIGNDLVLNGGQAVFELGSTTTEGGAANDLLNVAGDLVIAAPTALKVEPWNGVLDTTPGNYYTLIDYSGSLVGNPADLTVVSDSHYTLALDFSVPGKIRVSVTGGTPGILTWVGDWDTGLPQADWDVGLSQRWDGGDGFFYAGDSVTFDDSAYSYTVNLVGSLYASSTTLNNDSTDYTFVGSGKLSGGGLIKANSAKLTLANTGLNDYAGTTDIRTGSLQVGDGGTAGNLPVGSFITNNGALIFNRSDAFTLPNVITGTGLLQQDGSGTLTLSSANTFAGPVNVNAGTLKPGHAWAFGTNGNSITVNNGGQVDLNGVALANRLFNYTLSGAGPDGRGALLNTGGAVSGNSGISNVTLAADAAVGAFGTGSDLGRYDFGSGNTTASQYGLFDGGNFTLTKVGPGVVNLRIPAINFPLLVVSNGAFKGENFDFNLATNIVVHSNAAIGAYGFRTNSSAITLMAGATNYNDGGNGYAAWLGPITNLGPATLQVTGINGNGNIGVFGNLYGTDWYNILGANSRFVELWANNDATFSGNWNIPSGNTLRLSGDGTPGTGTITNNGTIEVFNTNATTLAATVLGAGNFNQQAGAAPITLTTLVQAANVRAQSGKFANPLVLAAGANIQTPNLLIGQANGAGALEIQAGAIAAVGSFHLGEQSSQTGQVVQVGGSITVSNQLRVGHWGNNISTYLMGGGSLTLVGVPAGVVNLGGQPEQNGIIYLGIDGVGWFTQTGGVVSAPGLVMDGRSSSTVGGAVGTYALEGGNLLLGQFGIKSGNTDGSTTYQIYLGGGTVSASANWVSTRAMNLTGTNGNVAFDPAGFTIGLGGVLSGNGGLVKNGAGTLILAGANTYFGTTLVNAGTLLYNGTLAAGAGQVTVAGGTLGGTGIINAPVVVEPAGTLSPATSIGTLTVSGPLTLAGNTVMEINKAGATRTSDRVVGVATLTYGGTLTVIATGDALVAGDSFDLFDAATFTGGFTSFALPALDPGLAWDTARLLVDGTIVVTGPPVLVTPPADQTVECSSNATFTVAVSSAGTLTYQWYFEATPIPTGTSATLVVASATDANEGQYSVVVQNAAGSFTAGPATLTVNDTTAPTITCPEDVTVQCDEDVPAADIASVTVLDGCDPAPVVQHVSDVAVAGTPKIITRTYRAVDASANIASCSQTITVLIARPDPLSYEPYAGYTAGSLVGQNYVGTGYAAGGSWTALSGDVSVSAMGGSAFTSGLLSLQTTGGKTTTPASGFNGATADLDITPAGPFGSRGLVDTGLIGGPTVTGTLYYSFLAKNNSGDVPNGDEDFAAVQLYNGASEVFGVGNHWSAWAYSTFGLGGDGDLIRPSDSAFKLMDGNVHLFVVKMEFAAGADDTVTVWMDPDLAVNEASQPNTVYRRTVTGNAAFDKIAVRSGSSNNDNSWDFDEIRFGADWDDVTPTAPAITTQPANVIAECPATNGVFTVTAVGTDPIGFQWYLADTPIPDGTNAVLNATAEGSYTVRVCNAYGSVTSVVVMLTVQDTTPPVITCPPDVAVQCDGEVPPADFAGGSISDTCDSHPVVTHEGDVALGTCPKVITRTYKVTDAAGLSATCTQTITVQDTTPPEINCGQNETVSCGLGWGFTVPIVTDNCDGLISGNVVPVSTVTNRACGYTFTATRVWQAADSCGNLSYCTQVVTVVDFTPPTITACPANQSVQCLSEVPPPDIALVEAANLVDPCDTTSPAITHIGDVVSGNCPKTITRTYRASDECGNFSDCVQVFIVNDTIAPTITCGQNETLSCGQAWDFVVPAVSDNCDANPVLTLVSTVTNTACGNTLTATRAWEVTDACGNTTTCSQTITVVDTTEPALTCPANLTVQCDTDVPAPDFAGGTVTDACDANPVVTHVSDVITGSDPKVITRTYKAVDACGNEATCAQTITVQDTQPPVITCPQDVTVSVDAGLCTASGVHLGTPEVTDACGLASVVNNAPAVFSLGTTVVTWTATDTGGNAATCTQNVTVQETQPPIITQQPQSLTVNVGQTATFTVTATACSGLSYQWFFGTNAIADATNATLSVANAQLTDAGDYSVEATSALGTTASAVAALTVNRIPVAGDNGAATTQDNPVSIAEAKLLYNDSDPDGDPLTLDSITATSVNGGTVVLAGGYVTYTPAAGFTGVDRFSYTVSDGRGGTASTDVEVFVTSGSLPSLNAVSISVTPNGYLIRFAGIPGREYELQRSGDLSNWSTIVTLTAPLHGIMDYEDTNPPPGAAFYRTVAP